MGVLDVTTFTFSTMRMAGFPDYGGGPMKYHGAAALGTRIFFAPHLQHNIGLLDTTTSTFSTVVFPLSKMEVSETGAIVQHEGLRDVFGRSYSGATALGTNVYFTPYARFTMHRIPHTRSATPLFSSVCFLCIGAGC